MSNDYELALNIIESTHNIIKTQANYGYFPKTIVREPAQFETFPLELITSKTWDHFFDFIAHHQGPVYLGNNSYCKELIENTNKDRVSMEIWRILENNLDITTSLPIILPTMNIFIILYINEKFIYDIKFNQSFNDNCLSLEYCNKIIKLGNDYEQYINEFIKLREFFIDFYHDVVEKYPIKPIVNWNLTKKYLQDNYCDIFINLANKLLSTVKLHFSPLIAVEFLISPKKFTNPEMSNQGLRFKSTNIPKGCIKYLNNRGIMRFRTDFEGNPLDIHFPD